MIHIKALLISLGYLYSPETTPHDTQIRHLSDNCNDAKEEIVIRDNQLPQTLSGADLTRVKLPQDLSGADLTNANLTGQHFTYTNFTNVQLKDAILTNTLCDYRQCFRDNVTMNKLIGGKWYLKNLPKDLKSIAQVYLARSPQSRASPDC